jgi:hypothetical protein
MCACKVAGMAMAWSCLARARVLVAWFRCRGDQETGRAPGVSRVWPTLLRIVLVKTRVFVGELYFFVTIGIVLLHWCFYGSKSEFSAGT